jgi:hypothetical protein
MYTREMFRWVRLKLALKVVGIHGVVAENRAAGEEKMHRTYSEGCGRRQLGLITDPNDVDHNLGEYLTNKKIRGSQSIN